MNCTAFETNFSGRQAMISVSSVGLKCDHYPAEITTSLQYIIYLFYFTVAL